jgi:outer membrane lipoprotein carrier protein
MYRRFFWLGTCFLWAGCFAGLLAEPDAKSDAKLLADRFESRYRSAHTLQATFLERYTENGRLTRVESGIAYFRRPGKMRWEYEAPEKNLFLVDGKTAWFYVPADHTATRVPAKASADWRTPLALLAGEVKISRVCGRVSTTTDEKPESSDDVMLRCDLRGAAPSSASPAPQTAYFEIAKNSGELVRILVRDPGGVGIEFHFANWQTNPHVEESLFQFHAPVGVAIVNGELASGNTAINP